MSGGWRRITTDVCEYVELHAASAFSFLAGASQPETLIERAVELEMRSMAIADRNGLYGVARFHMAAKRCEVKAHIGAEITVSSFGNRHSTSSWLPHQFPHESHAFSAALRIANRLPEPLPAHHALQDARSNEG